VPDAAQSELLQCPWVVPEDPLEAEWEAVRRTIDARELAQLEELRCVVQERGLDKHKACIGEGAAPHSQKAATLLRFLRARSGDCEAAAWLLEEALDWRADFDIDRKIREWRSEWAEGISPRVRVLQKYTFMAPLGLDLEGLPAVAIRHSVSDLGGLCREIGMETMLVYMAAMIEDQFERAHERMMERGHCLTNFIEVWDLYHALSPAGLGAVPFYKKYASVFDKVYPERLRVCFIIRVPWAWNTVWRFFEAIMPAATKKKIRIKGCRADSWLEEFRALLPDESIPDWLRLAEGCPSGGAVPKGALQQPAKT